MTLVKQPTKLNRPSHSKTVEEVHSEHVAAITPPEEILPAVIEPTYTGDLTDDELLSDQKQIEKTIKESFPPEFVAVLKKFSYLLSTVGLEFDEACLMIRYDPKDMLAKIKEFPIIQELVNIKELEYKVNLIKSVSRKAISGGDEKLAQWLLERRFPNEFNPKKGTGGPEKNSEDMLAMAVEFIQTSNDSNPLVRETSGRAFVIKKNSGEDIVTAVQSINNFLK